ncbi:hypothetical protein CL617_03305 [archaeon]|nr:hypothetical protein [archaeon]|tara:strand:- start:4033 stop:4965 length:933 start_codon:yes stop_codon:yes gene_type:complete
MRKRGQASVEMIIIIAVLLIILIVVVRLNSESLSFSNRINDEGKGKILLDDLENGINKVYRQGVGAKTKIYSGVPDNVQSLNISGSSMKLTFVSGVTFFKNFNFNLSGDFNVNEGNRFFFIESGDDSISISLDGNITSTTSTSTTSTSTTTTTLPTLTNTTVFYDGFENWNDNSCEHEGLWTDCDDGDGYIEKNNDEYNGSKSVRFKNHDADDDYLIKCVDVSSYSETFVNFYWKISGLDSGEYGKLEVKNTTTSYTEIFDSGEGSTSYTEKLIDITSYISTNTCVKFHVLASSGSDRFYVDDFRIIGQS